jgi:hypothetical protein
MPIPIDAAVATAQSVVGVTSATPRIWGVVQGDHKPLTIVGVDAKLRDNLDKLKVDLPGRGQVVCGPGVSDAVPGTALTLNGRSFELLHVLPATSALAMHDVVMLHSDDARAVLGLAAQQASDLALQVFHSSEATVLLPELRARMPWPVQLTTRAEAREASLAEIGRFSGLAVFATLTSVLGLLLLLAAMAWRGAGARREIALLKAFGWTTRQLLQLHIARVVLFGLPALIVGLVVAYGLVFGPANGWIARGLFAWSSAPPHLDLETTGAALTLLIVGTMVASIALLGSLWGALRSASVGAEELNAAEVVE